MIEPFRIAIDVAAAPERVFAYFVDPERLVRWMGDFARLEARDGGLFHVDINGVLIRGHYARLVPPHLLEIAWGEAGNPDMPPGATRLVIHLDRTAAGTHVRLEHHGLVPAEARKHAVGWPHFLGRLAIAGAGGDPGPDPWKTAPPG